MPDSPFFQVATDLKHIIEIEFAAESFTAIFDNLHESLGRERVDIGISPIEDDVMASDMNVQDTIVEVKFYLMWPQEISPNTTVDPTVITDYAHRFRKALKAFNQSATSNVWFYNLTRISYPNDPTGNKSRFVARITAKGNNAALMETTA